MAAFNKKIKELEKNNAKVLRMFRIWIKSVTQNRLIFYALTKEDQVRKALAEFKKARNTVTIARLSDPIGILVEPNEGEQTQLVSLGQL